MSLNDGETATSTVRGGNGGGLDSDFWLGLAVGIALTLLIAAIVVLVQRRRAAGRVVY